MAGFININSPDAVNFSIRNTIKRLQLEKQHVNRNYQCKQSTYILSIIRNMFYFFLLVIECLCFCIVICSVNGLVSI